MGVSSSFTMRPVRVASVRVMPVAALTWSRGISSGMVTKFRVSLVSVTRPLSARRKTVYGVPGFSPVNWADTCPSASGTTAGEAWSVSFSAL